MKRLLKLIAFFTFLGFTSTLLAQDGATASSLYNDGVEKMKAKNYKAALPLLEKAIEMAKAEETPNDEVIKLAQRNGAIATYYVGNGKRKEKKYDEALALYEKGTKYNPDSYINYLGMAQALSSKGDKAGAVTAYLGAAKVAEKAGKPDKASDYISKADKLSAISYGKKKYDEAIACAEAFLAVQESAGSHYYLAQSLKAKNQNGKALEHATKAAELSTEANKDKYYYVMGQLHEALGQNSEAVAAYKKVKGSKYGEQAKYKVSQLNK